MEFYYYACGEDKKGYNVFASEQECMKTCVPKGDPIHKSKWKCGSSSIVTNSVNGQAWAFNLINQWQLTLGREGIYRGNRPKPLTLKCCED